MLVEGKQLGGRYRIIQDVGGGGMAVVYKALDPLSNRMVAVKVMNENLSHDYEFVQRFVFEAKATRRLSHPNVVNVFDARREGNMYYMVMEYVEGMSLKELIQKKGSLKTFPLHTPSPYNTYCLHV